MPVDKWTSLQKNLARFGYLKPDEITAVKGAGDVGLALKHAITEAQADLGHRQPIEKLLHQKDWIDLFNLDTVLDGRFCGVPDKGGKIGPLTFGSPGGRWSKTSLKISINVAGCNFVPLPLVPLTAQAVIQSAFNAWQLASGFFQFSFVPPNTGEDIRVIFGGSAVDQRFGTPGGVLASAGYPQSGNLQFDSSETWTVNLLLTTAIHEIGHLLGLSHSNAPGGTMNPYVAGVAAVDAESTLAIRAIYGWAAQQNLGDRATSDRATLGITGFSNFTNRFTVPHMVWKGVDGDSGIYYSEFNGQWTPQQRVNGVGCSYSPALCEIGVAGAPVPTTGLLMAWKGVDDDSGIYWTRDLGSGWEGQRNVGGVGCSRSPGLANVNGTVFMAWKGVEDDSGIYWSQYDGAESWSPQQHVRGVGTSDAPALVAYQNKLFMFWKGIPGDSNAYYSSYDPVGDPIWKPQKRIEYFSYETDGGVSLAIGTSGPLTATVRGANIMLAWKGAGDDQTIWISFFANGEFSGQSAVPNVGTSVGPTLVDIGGQTFMAWKGVDGDDGIYWSAL
jgi:hypothetical protein